MVALLLVVFVNFVGIGALIPIQPFVVIEELGHSATVMTALLASFSLAMFVANPILGRLSDRYGRRPVFFISLSLNIIAHLWFAFSNDIIQLFLARILAGVGAGNIGVIQAIIADKVPQKDRARMMGLIGAAIGAGFVLGPAIGGVLSGIGDGPIHRVPFLVAAAFGFFALILAILGLKNETRTAPASPLAKGAFASRLFLLLRGPLGLFALAFFLLNLAFAQVEASFVLLLRDLMGYGAIEAGWVFTYIGFCIILVQGGLIGRTVARLGEYRTILMGVMLLCVGQFLAAIIGSEALVITSLPMLAQLLFITTLICFGFAYTNPTLSAASSSVADEGDMGGALGLVQGFGSLGQVIGLTLAGPFYEIGGSGLNYGAAAAITLGLFGVVLLVQRLATRQRVA